MGWVRVGWVSLVGEGRERLAKVLIDTRYFTEWLNYLPHGLKRSVLDCVYKVIGIG